MFVASIYCFLFDVLLSFCSIIRMVNLIMYLKDYCGWAASFCYSFKLQLCLVIGCCWSSFVLDLLQDVATTKGEYQFILHFVSVFDFVKLIILQEAEF